MRKMLMVVMMLVSVNAFADYSSEQQELQRKYDETLRQSQDLANQERLNDIEDKLNQLENQ